jgi:hypothetical protein
MALTNKEHALVDGWTQSIIDNIVQGERFDVEVDLIEPSNSSLARNVLYNKGRVESDHGYRAFADVGIWGSPRKTHTFVHASGTEEKILITNESVFKHNSTLNKWHAIKGLIDTTTTQVEAAGASSVTVASATGFSASDHVYVILDNGDQHKTTIASIATLVINLDDNIPSGRSVGSGAAVEVPVVLTGTDDKPVDVVTWQASDLMIFTNGVDVVKEYNKTAVVTVTDLPSSGNTIARTVAVYENYVMLGFTTEGGTSYPFRVRRCDTGDPTNWTSGNAGFDDLLDGTSDIQFMNKIGPYVIVYRDKEIVRGELVAADDKLFDFNTAVAEDGVIGPEGVATVGDSDIFIGHKTIWQYQGGTDIKDIGGPIFEKIFGVSGDLNTQYRNRIRADFISELGEAWFVYPISGETHARRLRRYKLATESWSSRDFTHSITSLGFHTRNASLSWNDASGSWASQTGTWDSRTALKDAPTILLGLNSTPQVVEYDYIQTVDTNSAGSTAISVELRSKDFSSIDKLVRYDRCHFMSKGQAVLVEYSVDSGTTWITLGTLAASSAYTQKVLHKQIVTRTLMLRWTATGADFGLGWFSLIHREESVVGGI